MDSEFIAVFVTVGGSALLGVVTFLVRSTYRWWVAKKQRRAELVARLRQLASLLNGSRSVFLAQGAQRDRLWALLNDRGAGRVAGASGYEALFTEMYDSFTPEEMQLHGIIRSMTEESLGTINGSISNWLAEDSTFKYGLYPFRSSLRLSVYLNQLELHLLLWHAKYKFWMRDEKHALVYMADEKRHGTGFPGGIEKVVEAALEELGQPTISELQAILDS